MLFPPAFPRESPDDISIVIIIIITYNYNNNNSSRFNLRATRRTTRKVKMWVTWDETLIFTLYDKRNYLYSLSYIYSYTTRS